MAFNNALIVDDSKLARITLKKKLESYGLAVVVAESAEQAYAAIKAATPDIIFMDHLMPDIDGFEATQYLRKQPATVATPIIMCTGKEHDSYLDEALEIGASQILTKPPADEALEAILNTDFDDVALHEDMEVYHTQDTSILSADGLDDLQSNIIEVRNTAEMTQQTTAKTTTDFDADLSSDDDQSIELQSNELQELQQQIDTIKQQSKQNFTELKSSIDMLSNAQKPEPQVDASALQKQLQRQTQQQVEQASSSLQSQLQTLEEQLQTLSRTIKSIENQPVPVGISWDESKALIKRAFAQYKEKQPEYVHAKELAEFKQSMVSQLDQQQQTSNTQAQSLTQLLQQNEAGTNNTGLEEKVELLIKQQNDLQKLGSLPKHLSSIAIALGFCALALSIYMFVR